MAKASGELVNVIRTAARKIESSQLYQWGHMGSCNCGFLAQEVTQLSKQEIHRRALERHGDWNEQLNDYCPTSGLPMDDLISELVAFGFDTDDLKHLERLSSTEVLRSIPLTDRNLNYNVKADVVKYMNAWATVLEEELLPQIKITLPRQEAIL